MTMQKLIVNDVVVGQVKVTASGHILNVEINKRFVEPASGILFGTTDRDVTRDEPTQAGFYRYSGGAGNMMFLLRKLEGGNSSWYVLADNGEYDVCDWGYIEQGLGVWDLVKI